MKYGNYEWPNVYEEAEEMIISKLKVMLCYKGSCFLTLAIK